MFEALLNKFANLATLDQNQVIHDIIEKPEVKELIPEMNREQLLAGVGADSQSLPKYTDDSHFKTVKAAEAYQSWKKHVSPNKSKPIDVMDFYIDGTFHDTIDVQNNEDNFTLISPSAIADDVESKTSNQSLGLTNENIDKLMPTIKNSIIEKIKDLIAA